ncbi:alanine racemase [Spirosoma oryzae]|uniref:Alanine racemase n=1 Tax=Spirosoma oryzae TaxID=1469603 RepID=A0A2T0RJJ0_9BACT|nr:bifunctional UDP-N-acetylmuramoyl-tripeptide:D-alanyl-D-alanine ligase/alanine racemase [Spirosoma oryzae]PRY21287.1 alanine racemase [Spirosoma oryzae]
MLTKSTQHIRPRWLTDSRQAMGDTSQSVFFAIRGEHHDGHAFIGELYARGVRQFVVERAALSPDRRAELASYPDAEFIEVDSSLALLQQLATEHRRLFPLPVIGITGSNGKTIVKEWLAQLLADDYVIAKSPRSYNSQLGVPLSVRELGERHTLGLFEAGISRPHEMQTLEPIIRPTVGIFTNIGPAHDEGFRSRKQKIAEKLRLFVHADTLIYCADQTDVADEVNMLLKAVNPGIRLVTWSLKGNDATYRATLTGTRLDLVALKVERAPVEIELPFTDAASVENLLHCLVAVQTIHPLTAATLDRRLRRLRPVSMRLEQKEGINNSVLIDDSYSNDLAGLQLALRFMNQQRSRGQRVLILSDVLQSGQADDELYTQIADQVREAEISLFVGVGPVLSRHRDRFPPGSLFYASTAQWLAEFPVDRVRESMVLVKGARTFAFEQIVNRLQRKVHGTRLEIDLDALTHNLNYYREKIGPATKIMVMVKAFAYGSGSAEVAQLLQYHRVDYLAVAYADEGVSLRQNGVTLPIMVMNPSPETFPVLLDYQLQPEIYSQQLLADWGRFAEESKGDLPPIHLKMDTGMHRLGFLENELPALIAYLTAHPALRVETVFSHLVGADEAQFNAFSRQQYDTFIRCTETLRAGLGYLPTRHLLNSAGIVRFPEFRLDMVRLGIGLYGVESSGIESAAVWPVGTLKTVVSQVKTIPAGESVGYSRRGQLDHTAQVATLAIGYADGFDRRLGNGVGAVWINGHRCLTVGNVCMDMTMVDATNVPVAAGDDAVIFGPDQPISVLAKQIGTIPYEILTGVSERVKRVFFKE